MPEPDLSGLLMEERRGEDGRKIYIDQGSIPLLNSVLWSGLLTALSLGLHNFPGACVRALWHFLLLSTYRLH